MSKNHGAEPVEDAQELSSVRKHSGLRVPAPYLHFEYYLYLVLKYSIRINMA